MPNYGTIAICPYFQSEDAIHIKCDGIVQTHKASTEFVMRFSSKEQKKDWQRIYCETYEYLKCPYAAMIDKQWDETGKCINNISKNTIR